jgi:tetratricopeptide (TPR) repeat protein
MHAGRYDESVASSQQALERDERYLNAWINLGAAQFRRKEYQEAFVAYSTAHTIDNASQLAWSGLVKTLLRLRRYKEAWRTLLARTSPSITGMRTAP